jgi:transposase
VGRNKKAKPPRRRRRRAAVPRHEVDLAQLEDILSRVQGLADDELATLKGAVGTLAFVTNELERKGVTIRYLRHLLFGSSSEKAKDVLPNDGGDDDDDEPGSPDTSDKDKPKKGHGRNGAGDYPSAAREPVAHPSLQAGCQCPHCERGTLFVLKEPSQLVRVRGMPPLVAKVYELERLRCSGCQQVFTTPSPEGVGDEKYDASAVAMVGMLRYGTGMPFNRLEKLQASMGIPLPASTQWDLVKVGADKLQPVLEELVDAAAQSKAIHNDDTYMPVVQLMNEKTRPKEPGMEERTGMFTTAIVAERDDGKKVALYMTGAKHAGENIARVLAQRRDELEPIIQMADALTRNDPKDIETRRGACNTHARRKFVEQIENFPDDSAHIVEVFGELYDNEAVTRDQKMSDEERLAYHREHSASLMAYLQVWAQAKLDDKDVEPNSGLGGAVRYLLNHWDKLTLFLRVPGAPVDNNICERALKMAIRHRKNSLFYKSLNGARVGDTWMSLTHTAQLAGVDVFDYLTALLRNHVDVEREPAAWLPWAYRQTIDGAQPPAG